MCLCDPQHGGAPEESRLREATDAEIDALRYVRLFSLNSARKRYVLSDDLSGEQLLTRLTWRRADYEANSAEVLSMILGVVTSTDNAFQAGEGADKS